MDTEILRETFEAIGTNWDIVINQEVSLEEKQRIFHALRERIELFEATYSRFRSNSIVDKIAREKGVYTLPPDARIMFDLYEKMYEVTNGLVTPLIGNTLVEAGYDKRYSLIKKKLHAPPTWESVLKYEFPKLATNTPTQLDLGAIGKGYLIDIVGALLEENGITEYHINAGGDIRQRSGAGSSLTVGLEHPKEEESAIGKINIMNKSICGSSGNRRMWANMHHIINPYTQHSPDNIIAVWALADTTILADAMTSALFFTDPERLREEFDFEYLIMNADSSVLHSVNFNATFFRS